jgi:hypothetical protein
MFSRDDIEAAAPRLARTAYQNCGHWKLYRSGHTDNGDQRLECAFCGKKFYPGGPLQPGTMRRAENVRALAEAFGRGMRNATEAARLVGCDRHTAQRYFRWFRQLVIERVA